MVVAKVGSTTMRRGTRSAKTKKTPGKSKSKPASSATQRASSKPRQRGELGGPNEALWRSYSRTRDPAVRNELMEMHLSVVHFIAERLLQTLPRSIELDDLKSAGVFGLMDAIDGFDIDRGIKFKTYCSTRVRGAILDELRSQDWVPRLVRLRAHQLTKAQVGLEAVHGRVPNVAEMADALNLGLNEYLAMVQEARARVVQSLSEAWDDGSGDQAVEKVDYLKDASAPDPAEILNQKDVMIAMIRSLSKREKEIILMYYRDGLTMKQIGQLMSLTESRVCQIHSNVMKKLKMHLDGSQGHLAM